MIRSKTLMALGLAVGLMPLADSAMAAGPFDGVYAGFERETKNANNGYCHDINRDDLRTTVTDSAIQWKWGGVQLKATIAPDGSFSTSAAGWANGSGAFLFHGRVTGGNLEADVGNNTCATHISMKKT
jgi:hypothetical protein